jgi:endoglucanase
MKKENREFLYELLTTPSPSGFEQPVQKIVKKRMKKFADELRADVHGNLIACFNPDAPIRVMLAGHCDQIGLMVTHIGDSGYLSVNQIGGIDSAVLPGLKVLVHTENGAVEGVIGHQPVHLTPPEKRGAKVDLKKVWVDVGLDGKEAKKQIRVGDPITFDLQVTELGKNCISAPGCDDKVGLYVVMEALRIVSTKIKGSAKKKFPVALHAVSTVQEEIGLRGARTSAFGIDPLVGIAVDVTHATDNPGAIAKQVGTINLGDGPVISRGANINNVLEKLLFETARKKKIKHQPLSAPNATGTDANAMQITRQGVAAGLIGIPNRYMHTPIEVVDLRDLDAAALLIAEAVMSINKKMTFLPV